MAKRQSVQRTRNMNTLTEAEFFSKIRSALRNISRFWKPIQEAKKRARRKYTGRNKLQKWEYKCAACGKFFKEKEVQIDHSIEVGSLKSYNDLPQFCERLFCEDISKYKCVCKPCHQEKTNLTRQNKSK